MTYIDLRDDVDSSTMTIGRSFKLGVVCIGAFCLGFLAIVAISNSTPKAESTNLLGLTNVKTNPEMGVAMSPLASTARGAGSPFLGRLNPLTQSISAMRTSLQPLRATVVRAEAKAFASAAAWSHSHPGRSAIAAQAYNTGLRLAMREGTRSGCRGSRVCMRAVGLFFGTQTGKTEDVAGKIGEAAGGLEATDIGEVEAGDLAGYDGLIVGAPTWHTGADEQRSGTSWDDYLDDIKGLDLCGKPVAIFGTGDSAGYGDNFCDAIEELHSTFSAAGAKMVGYVDASGYQHTDSKSVADGKFVGLPLDEDNEDDMTEDRVGKWVAQLKSEGMPIS